MLVASAAAVEIASDLAANIAVFLFVTSVAIAADIDDATASIALWFVKYLLLPSDTEVVDSAAIAVAKSADTDIESGSCEVGILPRAFSVATPLASPALNA